MNQSMAAKLSTCLWTHRLAGPHHHRRRSSVGGLVLPPSPRLLPASCKMRNRNPSSQYKSQGMKKAPPELLPSDADFQPNGDEDIVPILNQEIISNAGENSVLVEHTNVNDVGRPHKPDKTKSTKKRQQFGKASTEPLPTNADFNAKSDEESVSENTSTTDSVPGLNLESVSDNDIENAILVEHIDVNDAVTVSLPSKAKLQVIKKDGGEQLSNIQLEDLIGLIRNAEKNILLLNQARVDALEDLGKILTEKEMLQAEINTLEMRLAETDARIKVAAQDKIHVELLENQLEKLLDELNYKGVPERSELDMNTKQEKVLNGEVAQSHESSLHSLSKELSALRLENKSLNNDIQTLKAELNGIKNIDLKKDVEVLKAEFNNVKNTDERVVALEKERLVLEASLKNLESKLSISQEDISKLSTLKSECKHLWEKVESLQSLLDKATKQADQAIFVLQQNQELRKKVDQLEETLNEAKVYKLSSDKMQQYNELMVQKIRTLEEHLQKSDEDIYSYVQLYQESVKEFQDTLDVLKEESKKRALDEPADDMPREFWSRVLLVIDGWLLEKKISTDDAKLLREMVWKRNGRIREAYKNCKGKNEQEALSIFLRLISSPTSPGLHVIHIAAEMAPVAKVGGLGDVVTGLSKALQKRGHLLEIILPKYDCMEYDHIRDLRVLDMELESYFGGQLFKNKIWVGTVEGLPVYFIEPLHPDKFFWRGQVYGERDDFKRFSYFSRAALELILQSGKKPDIIHCHDWQTAFVAPLYWDLYAPKGLNSARICFTCHNFEYQGTAPASELASCGLDVNQLNRPDRMQDNSFHDRINPIKGAIVFSNIVTTVSPTYGQEVRTAEGGRGLHSTLNFHSKKFYGILNGIDTDTWNPAADAFLKVQYSANDLKGKSENKLALRAHLGLSAADAKRPLVGCITRLVPQKGVHLIRHAMFRTLELGGQFVLLGSSPVPQIQREFESIAQQFQDHEHIRLILKYDESLSHSIYAASDMFIIPSLFEPCGLTQLIAMRYGAVPIARKTGGLSDSVFDLDDNTIPSQFQNGFTFTTPDEQGLNNALERAFKHYKNNEKWEQIVQRVMNIDFSWDSSAVQYEDLYLKSVARARATRTT